MALDETLPLAGDGDVETEPLTEGSATIGSEPHPSRFPLRIPLVLIAAIGVLIASLAPSVTLGIHLLKEPLSFENWTFSYPLTIVGLVGVALLSVSLSQRPVQAWPWAIWPLALLLLWTLLSVSWSVTPELTQSRALTAVGIAAFGVWFGYELRFDEQLVALALFSAAATIGSYVLIIWWPLLSRNDFGGYGWQGAFVGPNSLGAAAAVGVVAAVGLAVRYRHRTVVAASVAGALANLVLLERSTSVTAAVGLGIATVAVGVVFIVLKLRAVGVPGRTVGTVVGLVSGAALFAAYAALGSIASFLGQDPTLAGRTSIWSDAQQFISDRPIAGYGYWAIWENLEYTGASYERLGVAYGSAHNSMFEMWIGLGAVGAVLFGAVVLAAVTVAARRVWRFGSVATIGWAVFLAVVLSEHLMESFVLWHSYMWMLLIAAAFLPTSTREAAERWGSSQP